jgi:hypothetical protein
VRVRGGGLVVGVSVPAGLQAIVGEVLLVKPSMRIVPRSAPSAKVLRNLKAVARKEVDIFKLGGVGAVAEALARVERATAADVWAAREDLRTTVMLTLATTAVARLRGAPDVPAARVHEMRAVDAVVATVRAVEDADGRRDGVMGGESASRPSVSLQLFSSFRRCARAA